jgi:ABC-type dipeptide/oligopeptide/nickel transport system permease component
VLRRLAALVLLAVGITLVVFALTQLVPSNAVATNLGEQAAGRSCGRRRLQRRTTVSTSRFPFATGST